MSAVLQAFQPDESKQSDAGSFRCDRATVAQVLDWWEHNTAREYTSDVAETERRRLWGLLRKAMGDYVVLECRPFQLDNFIKGDHRSDSEHARHVVKKKANNTLRRWNTTLQQPFNEAELQGLIIKNPFRGLSYPEGDEGRDWTDDEVKEVLDNASQALAELIIGMRLSSLRPKEACNLDWRQVRFDAGNIKLVDHKSWHRTRTAAHVPLNQPFIDLLNEIKNRNNPGHRVFLTPKKRPWTRDHADSTFRRLREKLGLPEDLKLHGCRHTFATGAILNDVGVMHLQQILRHADIRTTQRYVHLVDKTDHLVPSMNKAVEKVKNITKATEYTPLFDGLD